MGIVVGTSGDAWLVGSTSSTDYPVSADASDPTFNGGSADAFISQLNAAGSALPFSTFLGGSLSEQATDIGRDSAGNLYVTGITFSQNFPATTGAFDTIFNGDPSIFWGDAFVTKVSLTGGNTPPAPPGVPPAPTLLSPSNASSQSQPIGFDWSDVQSAVDVSDPDRRFERVHRSARARCVRLGVELRGRRPAGRDAVLARPRRQLRRRSGCMVGDPQLHGAGASAPDLGDERRHQSDDGRRR